YQIRRQNRGDQLGRDVGDAADQPKRHNVCGDEPGPPQGGPGPRRGKVHHSVSVQLSMNPVSCAAASCTRSFQVPLRASLDRLTVKVWSTLAAEPPDRLSSV